MTQSGEPVFIDSEYETWNMDPKAFEIYPDVKVVIFVHLYGVPGKIDECKKICDEHGALLIEDAAESLGAFTEITDRKTGEKIDVPSGSVGGLRNYLHEREQDYYRKQRRMPDCTG